MTKFYTSVYQFGNNIFCKYVENGVRKTIKSQFKPSLFLPSSNESKYKTLYGTSVEPMKFGSIKDAKEFVQSYKDVDNFEIFGNTDWKLQYVSQNFENNVYDPKYIRIGEIDIEVESDNGFPEPEEAKHTIQSITFKSSESDTYIALGLVNYDVSKSLHKEKIKYFHCKNEFDLLDKFVSLWQRMDIDIVTGWNIRFFDIPYLVNRIAKVLGDEYVKRLSPWGFVNSEEVYVSGKPQLAYKIAGVEQLDYLDCFKKFAYKYGTQESYKLDYIAHVVLGENKMDYSEYGSLTSLYRENPQLFIDYNIKDVIIIDRMEKKLQLIQQCIAFAHRSGVNYSEVFGPVRVWDAIIFSECCKNNIVIPSKNSSEKFGQIEGGYVKDITPNMYNWVVSFDAASLYPSIIMMYNMSPETIGPKMDRISVDDLLERPPLNIPENHSITATGQTFRKDTRGIIPNLIERMFNERASIRKRVSQLEKEDKEKYEDEITMLDNKQMVTKIALNSLYGALSNQGFRYFDDRIAEAVTVTGQLTIKWGQKTANEYLNKICGTDDHDYVVASDTDSVVGETEIYVNGERITIEEYYNSKKDNFLKNDSFNEDYVKKVDESDMTYSIGKNGELNKNKISYVMKHNVKKQMFKIKFKNNFVIVTGDHSIIIKDKKTNEIKSIKPKNLSPKKHEIINIVIDTDSDRGRNEEKKIVQRTNKRN